ncbi:hypothetical protein [Orenia marismortui]|uniref:Nuclease SbcCD subunit C n=1 Tax=Orenia marismortui TaxID=46469 RepID=A0A4R8H0H6_9FIRM|nr:hypothetical protein [Orenia marismortui]TDX52908.1 hypothetical protein C7959_10433 [Orenia marismortui]
MLESNLNNPNMLIKELEANINHLKSSYNQQKGRKEQLEEDIEKKEKELLKCKSEIELLEQVNILFHETSEFAREQSRQQIESLVTNFLQYVFGENFSFEIEIRNRGGQPWADFYVVSQQGKYRVKNEPQDARGGGVVDVVSLALRIAILESHQKPKINGPVILDEPAKHVSEEYIVKVTRFLKQVNEMFGRQIIVVTHQQHLSEVADKAFRVELKEAKSQISTEIIY